jgi:hypothetical protein
MSKSRPYSVAASLTVYRVADMSDKGRKEICDWLRKQARDIQREPESFGQRFRARYLYAADAELRPAARKGNKS